MAGWRTNELKEKGKTGQNHVFCYPPCYLLQLRAGSQCLLDRGKLNNSSMMCSSLWCTCRPVEYFRRLLAQKSFFVVHVLCTCLFAFSLSSLSTFCYRICFDMEVVWPVIHKHPNYSYNYLDIRLQNITADFFQNWSFEVKGPLSTEKFASWDVNSCFVFHPQFSFFTWRTQYNLRWICVIFLSFFLWANACWIYSGGTFHIRPCCSRNVSLVFYWGNY